MTNKRVPVHLVTLWHPEKWLDLPVPSLVSLPHVEKKRADMEKAKREASQLRNLPIHDEIFHNRIIGNIGKSLDQYRRTWIRVSNLALCLRDFEPGLIRTLEDNPQSEWRLEYRPDWGRRNTPLDPVLRQRIIDNIQGAGKVSVRQVWLNPVAGRYGTLPLGIPEGIATETANLVLGPHDEKESPRPSGMELTKDKDRIWWLIYRA